MSSGYLTSFSYSWAYFLDYSNNFSTIFKNITWFDTGTLFVIRSKATAPYDHQSAVNPYCSLLYTSGAMYSFVPHFVAVLTRPPIGEAGKLSLHSPKSILKNKNFHFTFEQSSLKKDLDICKESGWSSWLLSGFPGPEARVWLSPGVATVQKPQNHKVCLTKNDQKVARPDLKMFKKWSQSLKHTNLDILLEFSKKKKF